MSRGEVIARNVALAVVGITANFGVRALIATWRTKDYFDKHVREARRLGFAERRVAVREGLAVNVAEGPSGGVGLLLIPGQGSVWQEYCKALPALVDTFHVLVVDVHGHGESTWNPDDYNAEQIAADLMAVADQVFTERVLIAGHSSGGLIAALMAANHPERVRGVVLEDPPFFATEPDRIAHTYFGMDIGTISESFLAQDGERDWICWYMPRSYWSKLFGPIWSIFTREVVRQRRQHPRRLPVIRWAGVKINRIWESMSHPFDLRFTRTFMDGSWFRDFDQANTLAAITCPTVFLKATTRHDRNGNLLAALDDHDLARVEQLLPSNTTTRVRGSHDIHFAHTGAYVRALNDLATRTTEPVSTVT